jgi:hypothetical protein
MLQTYILDEIHAIKRLPLGDKSPGFQLLPHDAGLTRPVIKQRIGQEGQGVIGADDFIKRNPNAMI